MSVQVTTEGPVAAITLDRVDAHNALNAAVLREIGAAIDEVARSDVRALVVTGAGPKAFCAGADIMEIAGRDAAEQRAATLFGQSTFAKLDHLPIPSVAVIHGFALGGGLELAMACTFRLATPAAQMGLPEITLGLIPGYGGTQRLPRLVGAAKALEMILSGRSIGAAEAERIGLVNAVVAPGDPLRIGHDFAARFVGLGRGATGLAREAVLAAQRVPLAEGLAIEADLLIRAFTPPDAAEGIAAFRDKRPARFNRDGGRSEAQQRAP